MAKLSAGGKLEQQLVSETSEGPITESQRKVALKEFSKERERQREEQEIISTIQSLGKPRVYRGAILYSGQLPPHKWKGQGVGGAGDTWAAAMQRWQQQEDVAKERYLSTKTRLQNLAQTKGLSEQGITEANQFLSQDDQLQDNLRISVSKQGRRKRSSSPDRFAKRGTSDFRTQQDLLRDPRPTSQTFSQVRELQKEGLTRREAVDVTTGRITLEQAQTKLQDKLRRKAEAEIKAELRSQGVDVKSVQVRNGQVKILAPDPAERTRQDVSHLQVVGVEDKRGQQLPFTPAPKDFLEELKKKPDSTREAKLEKKAKNLLTGLFALDRDSDRVETFDKSPSFTPITEKPPKENNTDKTNKFTRGSGVNFSKVHFKHSNVYDGAFKTFDEELRTYERDLSGNQEVRGIRKLMKDDGTLEYEPIIKELTTKEKFTQLKKELPSIVKEELLRLPSKEETALITFAAIEPTPFGEVGAGTSIGAIRTAKTSKRLVKSIGKIGITYKAADFTAGTSQRILTPFDTTKSKLPTILISSIPAALALGKASKLTAASSIEKKGVGAVFIADFGRHIADRPQSLAEKDFYAQTAASITGFAIGGKLGSASFSKRPFSYNPYRKTLPEAIKDVPKEFRTEFKDLYKTQKVLAKHTPTIQSIDFRRIKSIEKDPKAQRVIKRELIKGDEIVGGTIALEVGGIRIKRTPRDFDLYVADRQVQATLRKWKNIFESEGVKHRFTGKSIVSPKGEEIITVHGIEKQLRPTVLTVTPKGQTFEQNIFKTPEGINVVNPTRILQRKLLGGFEFQRGEPLQRYSKDIPEFKQASSQYLNELLLESNTKLLGQKQISQFKTGRVIDYSKPYDFLLEVQTKKPIPQSFIKKETLNFVKSRKDKIELKNPFQQEIIEFAKERKGRVGGSTSVEITLRKGLFRDTSRKDIDLYLERTADLRAASKEALRRVNILSKKVEGRPIYELKESRGSFKIELKEKLKDRSRVKAKYGEKLADILGKRKQDRVRVIDDLELIDYRQILSDKRNILKFEKNIFSKKFRKAKKDVRLIEDAISLGKIEVTTNLRPNPLTAGFGHIDFKEFGQMLRSRKGSFAQLEKRRAKTQESFYPELEKITPPKKGRVPPANFYEKIDKNYRNLYGKPYKAPEYKSLYPVVRDYYAQPKVQDYYPKVAAYKGPRAGAYSYPTQEYDGPNITTYYPPIKELTPKITKTPPPIKRTPPPTRLLQQLQTKEEQQRRVPGYYAEVKEIVRDRLGRIKEADYIRVHRKPLSFKDARSLGLRAVDESAAQSFKIVKAKKKATPKGDPYWDLFSHKVRQKVVRKISGKRTFTNRIFVEKRPFAIDTFGELQGITAKGWVAQRNSKAQYERQVKKALNQRILKQKNIFKGGKSNAISLY